MSIIVASGNLVLNFEIINHCLFIKFGCSFVAFIWTKILDNIITNLTY